MNMKVKLGDLVEFFNGYAFKSSDYVDCSNTVNCRMSNIRPDGSFDIEYNIKFLPDEFSDKYNDFILKDGDIIIAMTDMAGDPKILGVPTIVNTKGYTVLMNQRVGKLTLKSELIIPQYLKYTLISKPARDYFKSFAGGGVQLNIGKKEILKIELNLHNLEEQTEIVNRLDKIKIIIELRKQQLQQLDELVKARFVEMFGETGKQVLLTDYVWFQEGPGVRSVDFTSEGTILLTGSNINDNEISFGYKSDRHISSELSSDKYAHFMCDKDDILVVSSAIDPDKFDKKVVVVDVDKKYCLNTGIIRFKPNKQYLTLGYFREFLKTDYFKRQVSSEMRGIAQMHFGPSHLKQMTILLPSSLERQIEFESFVEQIDKSKVAVQKALDEAQTLFDSLMQEYFG